MRELQESWAVAPETVQEVLGMIHTLCREVHSAGARVEAPTEDSRLEWDLGLDSLARIELLSRLEQRFGAVVVAREVVEAETAGDVVWAVCGPPTSREARSERSFGGISRALSASTAVFHEPAQVVPDLLTRLAARDPDFVCVRLLEADGAVEEVLAGDLLSAARGVAHGLGRQIEAAEPVAVMLPTGRAFLEAFFGILLAGGVPVPLAPAARPSQTEDHLLRQVQILDSCRATQLISSSEVAALARLLRPRAETLRRVVTVDQLKKAENGVAAWRARPDDLALLQYTSGSTGLPKGVRLTHANLLSNLEAISRGLETGPEDVFVSWLPLYHDMGLIGGLLHPLHAGIPLVLLSPLTFLSRPERWILAIDEYRGTQTVAPNFAYEICQRRAAGLELGGIDLSCLRLALNGAEPVSPATIGRFRDRFVPHGFQPEAMLPVYGLAENSLAVTFPELGHLPREDRVDRDLLLSSGRAVPADIGVPDFSFVSCGVPVRGVELRLLDEAGREVEEREIGRVEFRGPSATGGYYRDEVATRELVSNGWVDSGDLGYMAGGELYLTGRSKDLVIHAGRNISPYALEEAVGDLSDVRKGCVAVFGVEDARLGTERLVIAAETRESSPERCADLVAAINETASKVVGVAPDDVCLVPPHALLKTSSGKIRRLACGQLYQEGSLSRPGGRSLWLQMVRVAGLSLMASARRVASRLPALLYSAYLWCLVAVLLPTIWAGAMVLPRISWRRAWASRLCRLFFAAAGVTPELEGRDLLPTDRGSVVAVNHASYFDTMILMAALPRQMSFVAKREFEASALASGLLRRLGVVFVDPQGMDPRPDMERMAERVAAGETLVVFVEGTFVRSAGLRPFRLGAFEVAARACRPVTPIALRGSRELLRDEQWWFRRSRPRITVCPPIAVGGSGFGEVLRLRDATRRSIAQHIDEPDLEARERIVGADRDLAVAEGAR